MNIKISAKKIITGMGLVTDTNLLQIKVIKEKHLEQVRELFDEHLPTALPATFQATNPDDFKVVGLVRGYLVVLQDDQGTFVKCHINTYAKWMIEQKRIGGQLWDVINLLRDEIPQLFTE